MDALYFINIKSKEVLISKEFNQRDNNIKIHIFLAELENLLKEEISPIINISNTIFLYKIELFPSLSKEEISSNTRASLVFMEGVL